MGGAALAGPEALFLNLSASEFNEWPVERRLDIIIHEYFHVLQIQLADDRVGVADEEIVKRGPRWLIEGSAEYVGWQVLAENGRHSFSDTKADQEAQARSITAFLQSMETWMGVRAAGELYGYSLAFMATDYLMIISNAEASSLSAFYDAIGSGVMWRDSFQNFFGRSVETFYSEFEEYRRSHLLRGL